MKFVKREIHYGLILRYTSMVAAGVAVNGGDSNFHFRNSRLRLMGS
jgi:hypothetical protein